MLIYEYTIDYYVNRLKNNNYFCFPGYSDAEFYSMMELRVGTKTGLGQIIDAKHGEKLLDVMKRRKNDPQWLFAIPKILWTLPLFEKHNIDDFLQRNDIAIVGYERDMVLDDLARDAGLYSLIRHLQGRKTILIGPSELSKHEMSFLGVWEHRKIPSPNLHLNEKEIDKIVEDVSGYSCIYLISAGVSSPILIDKLYNYNKDAFYIDCGSIWDAFVGIGGQRQWRADLYANPDKLIEWRRKNIYGY